MELSVSTTESVSTVLSTRVIDFIEKEVTHKLRVNGITADLHEDILSEVESKLEQHGVKIDYY